MLSFFKTSHELTYSVNRASLLCCLCNFETYLAAINTIKLMYLQHFLDMQKFGALVRAKGHLDSLLLTLPNLCILPLPPSRIN